MRSVRAMKKSSLFHLLFTVGALAIGSVQAQSMDYTVTGTFGDTAPLTQVSAADATFKATFSLLAQQPANPFTEAFDIVPKDFSYWLNGTLVFNNVAAYGLIGHGLQTLSPTLSLTLPGTANAGFTFDARQPNPLFQGSIGQPTLVAAEFTPLVAGFEWGTTGYSPLGTSHISAAAAVPEPSVAALLIIGVVTAGGFLAVKRCLLAVGHVAGAA
ncbi:MAG TPA: PEP-CTERM sorting domain-containing protein [Chthoniobacterales bacterium]